MDEVEEPFPSKRKASRSPNPSDAPAKRTKREEDGDEKAAAPHERKTSQSPAPIATSPATASRRSPEARRQPSAQPPPAAPPSKKPFSQEEKKRGQRLFGGLLSTLSQKPTSSQQKRRQDIEKRQQERAQQQRAEDDKRRTEKLAKIRATRQIEEVKFDEELMQTRHEHLLSRARYLKTRSQPSIYYLPWEPTKAQEAIIKDQVRQAEETIAREKAAFQTRKDRRLRNLGVTTTAGATNDHDGDSMELDGEREEAHTGRKETVGEPTSPSHTANNAPLPPQADRSHHRHTSLLHDRGRHNHHHDETGDELMMIQDAEDTVIY